MKAWNTVTNCHFKLSCTTTKYSPGEESPLIKICSGHIPIPCLAQVHLANHDYFVLRIYAHTCFRFCSRIRANKSILHFFYSTMSCVFSWCWPSVPWHVASSFTYGPSDHHYQCLSVLEVRPPPPPPLIELPSVYEISFYHALLTRSSNTERTMGWLYQKIMQIVCARFATRQECFGCSTWMGWLTWLAAAAATASAPESMLALLLRVIDWQQRRWRRRKDADPNPA